jgi:hypothetical protein
MLRVERDPLTRLDVQTRSAEVPAIPHGRQTGGRDTTDMLHLPIVGQRQLTGRDLCFHADTSCCGLSASVISNP